MLWTSRSRPKTWLFTGLHDITGILLTTATQIFTHSFSLSLSCFTSQVKGDPRLCYPNTAELFVWKEAALFHLASHNSSLVGLCSPWEPELGNTMSSAICFTQGMGGGHLPTSHLGGWQSPQVALSSLWGRQARLEAGGWRLRGSLPATRAFFWSKGCLLVECKRNHEFVWQLLCQVFLIYDFVYILF